MDYSSLLSPPVLAGVGAVALSSAYLYAMAPTPMQPLVDLENQSVTTSCGSRISPLCKNGELEDHAFEDSRTMFESFRRGVRLSGGGPCLGARTGMLPNFLFFTVDCILY